MKSDAFTQAYKELNPSQKQAVDTLEGPVMVVAGPGTGKTQILSLRIANILKTTDTDPGSILALTFTESGVKSMRSRLFSLIGTPAYYVRMHTFHGFCSDLIRQYPEYFTLNPDLQPLSDLDRFNLIQQILDQHPFDYIKPANSPYYYAHALLSGIHNLKHEGITPADYQSILASWEKDTVALEASSPRGSKTKIAALKKDLGKNRELLEVYIFYQQALLNLGRIDFEDMINFTLKALSDHPDLLITLQEQFQYFLVDEYQDTNSAQNRVVDLLASYWGDQANVFVVGDSNQSIFRFQGASLENILQFTDRYKNARLITLTDNYRSPQDILDAAAAVVKNNRTRLDTVLKMDLPALKSHQPKAALVRLAQFTSDVAEDYFIVTSIKKLLAKGVTPGDIAVIFRQNRDADRLISLLEKYNIPVKYQGNTSILADPHLIQLLTLLTSISRLSSSTENVDFFTLLNYPFFNLDPLDILKLTRAASQNKLNPADLLLADPPDLSAIISDPAPFKKLLSDLSRWSKDSLSKTLPDFLYQLVLEAGFLTYLESHPSASVKLNRLHTFISFASACYQQDPSLSLSSFLSQLDLLVKHNLPLNEAEITADQNAVVFTTAHKSKGMEWSYCFLYQCIDGKWGNVTNRELIKLAPGILKFQSLDNLEKNEDERRLFYVALTRAKSEVTVTSSAKYFQSSRSRDAFPSLFVSEIPASLAKVVNPAPYEAKLKSDLTSLFPPPVAASPSDNEAAFLRSLLSDNFHLSASALNTYLQCPYRFKLQYLIRVPLEEHPTLHFGSAVHKALELFYRAYLNSGTCPPEDDLLSFFDRDLSARPLSPAEKATRLKHGRRLLQAYYRLNKDCLAPPLFLEKWFGGRYRRLLLDDISLQGKVDRIDLIDPRKKLIRLIDYKTGQLKTLGQIEGSTKDSDGSNKRQLVFYKLLADLDPHFDYTVAEIQLDYVEAPLEIGRFHRHTIAVTPAEVNSLKQEIRRVMKDITALKFPKTTDYSLCQNCPFSRHCHPDSIPAAPVQMTLI